METPHMGTNNQPNTPPHHATPITPQPQHVSDPRPLNPEPITFVPNNHPISTSNSDQSVIKSYIEFMARRELIANNVEKFDNNPENFHTWKLTFKNMTKNISITPSEELSLIIEYTTNDSKKLVQKLHNAYIRYPEKGVTGSMDKIGKTVWVKRSIDQGPYR